MYSPSNIEWTETTWNPVTGCTKISQGCKFCYAERMAKRLQRMGVDKYKDGFSVRLHPEVLEVPLHWKGAKMIFVNSMSDLFHESVPLSFIKSVFEVMNKSPRHSYQILTKRPERVLECDHAVKWTKNIWLGTSIESSDVMYRLESLVKTSARVKFLSLEPLLGPLNNLNLDDIDWVIVGGESGPGARPMKTEWVRDIRDMCLLKDVPFFFKQWGGVFKKKTGRTLDGATWSEMPSSSEHLNV